MLLVVALKHAMLILIDAFYGICGTLEEAKEDLEAAILDYFEEEFDNCSSDRDVQSVNLVQWEQSLSCTEDGNVLQTKSTVLCSTIEIGK